MCIPFTHPHTCQKQACILPVLKAFACKQLRAFKTPRNIFEENCKNPSDKLSKEKCLFFFCINIFCMEIVNNLSKDFLQFFLRFFAEFEQSQLLTSEKNNKISFLNFKQLYRSFVIKHRSSWRPVVFCSDFPPTSRRSISVSVIYFLFFVTPRSLQCRSQRRS